MTTWVYRCTGCGMTFAVDVDAGTEPPETAPCPNCDGGEAQKAFMLPEMKGGCGCGSECGC